MRSLSYAHWIGLLASLIAIATPFIPVVQQSRYDLLFALCIALIAVLFIVQENLYLKTNWRRKKKYPEIFSLLNGAYSALHQLGFLSATNKVLIKSAFTQSLSKLSEALSRTTNSKVCVSLKILKDDFKVHGYNTRIETFARDNNASGARNNPTYQSPMTIDENSDFREITHHLKADNNVCPFFSNDLLKDALKGYKNSRFGHEFYEAIRKFNNAKGYSVLKKIWTLEYKSTIVVPIYPLNTDQEHDLIGFLCVDSPDTDAFLAYDVEILTGLAAEMSLYKGYIKAYYAAE